ncbi:hypothetical protein IMG5_092210 [Ichthyophthirius multifiliis]|uniref:40S ribosomal protein S21 n=1 Tax=Ichthyophthirius multifiliis TaxID=5932 RepID=G0QRE7_ICHMU|nr:hypothetical protein IMG5_092210 [Ichthyophthirius multifiliis]EGR32216.1 hypothetical protein IMG5_092210 [Ichthyophthirius multifiliis]|eukprot:XP_004035702.1 hypothetical protein IMG5_092210 [Ichthyophthirius multifiliis]
MNAGRKNQWSKAMTGLVNDQKVLVDQYLPRKCEWTNRIIHSTDASSIQVNVAEVGLNGQMSGKKTSVILSGYIRAKGDSHVALETVLKEKGLYPIQE